MSFIRTCGRCFASTWLVALAALPAAGQDFRGSIAGTVTDQTGGVLPGVTVTTTNIDTGVSQHMVTDAGGLYQVFYLNAGTYSVTAELSGFKKVMRAGNTVRVGDVLRVDITMQAGAIEETVTVTADVPLLNRPGSVGRRLTASRSRSCRSATARRTC